MNSTRTHDHPWTIEDYQYFINRAEVYNLKHLADVLLVFFKKDFPNEVPDHVMSQRGTRPERVFIVGQSNHGRTYDASTVPEPPLGG